MSEDSFDEILGQMTDPSHTCKSCDFMVCPALAVFASRIKEAHEREVSALNKTIYALEGKLADISSGGDDGQ